MALKEPFFSRFLEKQPRFPDRNPSRDRKHQDLNEWTHKWPSDSDDNWEATFKP